MKLFKVYVKDFWYNEYDGCIIAAKSKKEVRALFTRNEQYRLTSVENPNGENVYFEDIQGKIHIEEINLNNLDKPAILLASFNASPYLKRMCEE